ncbi:MAG TPA: family 16 glycoside hydrolase [Rhodothermales bacterium]|nr:family 16 glycoside hydrolase [Rhodothermales bacterium]
MRIPRINGLLAASIICLLVTALPTPLLAQHWKAHDLNRPRPPVVTPPTQHLPVPAPADAVVLFDGTDLSQWQATDGSPTQWKIENGEMISVAGAGYIQTKQAFGDVQLHVEWAAPTPVQGSSQGRGNSGVFLMSRYEVQVLDSYENETYADGQAAALYGQHPPLFNASRPPGEWQTYDIYFRRPRFSQTGAVLEPARATVVHNGILVQNNAEFWGPTEWLQSTFYQPHADRLPLALQDHGNPVRYRNIWLRTLPENTAAGPPSGTYEQRTPLSAEVLDRYVGRYEAGPNYYHRISRSGNTLFFHLGGQRALELIPVSTERFVLKRTAGSLDFDLDANGMPTGFTFRMGGSDMPATKVE